MNLICSLGWHSPEPLPRWNDGYYFSRCRRCGCDLVRTAYEKWHVPDGYRVVWSVEPPPDRASVDFVPETGETSATDVPTASVSESNMVREESRETERYEAEATPPLEHEPAHAAPAEPDAGTTMQQEPDETWTEPIGAVTTDADEPPAQDEIEPASMPDLETVPAVGVNEPGEATAERSPARVQTMAGEGKKRLPIDELFSRLRRGRERPVAEATPPRAPGDWDFMSDDPGDELLIKPSGSSGSDYDPVPHLSGIDQSPSEPVEGGWRSGLARRFGSTRDALFGTVEEEPKGLALLGLAVAISAAVALVATLIIPSSPVGDGTPPRTTPSALAAPAALPVHRPHAAQPSGPIRYVAARALACRDSPSLEGQRVRTLARGDAVTLLAQEGDWASLSHRGRQCWALGSLLSPVPPA
jgi:hypothetical protein